MTLFEILIVGHLIADILIQPAKMAYAKLTQWRVRLIHCFVVYAPTIIILWAFGLMSLHYPEPSWWSVFTAYLYVGASHYLFDSLKVKQWWMKYIREEEHPGESIVILIDQSFHIVSLAFLILYW